MTDVVKQVTIAAAIEQVWAALTDAGTIAAWMDDDSAAVDLKVGGAYALFGRETTGTFKRIEPPGLLEYTWRQSSWPRAWKDSLVRWELSAEDGTTRVKLTHSAFPNDDERDSHDGGWDVYWLQPMIDYLERGA